MGEYTVIALTEPVLFQSLLERFAAVLLPKTESVSKALPGRLWRIFANASVLSDKNTINIRPVLFLAVRVHDHRLFDGMIGTIDGNDR